MIILIGLVLRFQTAFEHIWNGQSNMEIEHPGWFSPTKAPILRFFPAMFDYQRVRIEISAL